MLQDICTKRISTDLHMATDNLLGKPHFAQSSVSKPAQLTMFGGMYKALDSLSFSSKRDPIGRDLTR